MRLELSRTLAQSLGGQRLTFVEFFAWSGQQKNAHLYHVSPSRFSNWLLRNRLESNLRPLARIT
jgi:hypothetical protein